MIGLELPSRRLSLAFFLVAALVLSLPSSVWSQAMTPDQEEQLQILSDPGAPKKKTEKDKVRAPFEFFKSQVTPFDVLPYVKANHWATFALELRANEEDYDGYLQTVPVMLQGNAPRIDLPARRPPLEGAASTIAVSGHAERGAQGMDDRHGPSRCVASRRRAGRRA